MGKLVIGVARFLFSCIVVLALPALAASQPDAPSGLRVYTYPDGYGLWLFWTVNSKNELGFETG
jgi:hypothetical protein